MKSKVIKADKDPLAEKLDGRTVYIMELDQPYVNYYAEVKRDNGKLLYINTYDDYGSFEDITIISRDQIYEVID